MHDGGHGGVVSSEGDGRDGLDTGHEGVQQGRLFNVQHRGREDRTVVVDLSDGHSVGERRDVEHVQQCRLGLSDSITGLEQVNVIDDLDGPPSDLGGDIEGLEERCLARFHTGVSGGDVDVVGRKSTCPGRSGDLVLQDGIPDLLEVPRSEHEPDVAPDEGQEPLELRTVGKDTSESSSDHRVLAHEDDTGAPEGLSDHVKLLRRDVVDVDDKDRGVLLDQSL